jgi:hypothetical protein
MMGGVNSRLLTQVPTLGWPFLRNSKNKTKPNKTKQNKRGGSRSSLI